MEKEKVVNQNFINDHFTRVTSGQIPVQNNTIAQKGILPMISSREWFARFGPFCQLTNTYKRN